MLKKVLYLYISYRVVLTLTSDGNYKVIYRRVGPLGSGVVRPPYLFKVVHLLRVTSFYIKPK